MNLPTLYKITKTGAIQVCFISTDNETMIVEFGQLNGKMQVSTTLCKPKNEGKSNETSGSEQAILEAEAKHKKKIKSGYVLDPSGKSTVKLPMKVKVIQDQWKNVEYPCISTPKYNGVNGTYRLEDGKLNLYSRGGDIRPEIPHLNTDILDALELLDSKEINVELYKHGEHLQDLSSAVTKTNELSSLLQAYIFDISDSNEIYKQRLNKLVYASKTFSSKNVKFVTGMICNKQDDIEFFYNECIDNELEGTVVKNYKGLYKHNERSSDQFKYKKALDAEYITIGYNLDKHNHPVWTCLCNISIKDFNEQCNTLIGSKLTKFIKLHTFSVKKKGTADQRLMEANFANKYLGRWLKVEYETLSKDSKPLKPVGITWRTCDADGNPIE